jgi:hypothetical protein
MKTRRGQARNLRDIAGRPVNGAENDDNAGGNAAGGRHDSRAFYAGGKRYVF